MGEQARAIERRTNMKKRASTPNRGAEDERAAIVSKLTRILGEMRTVHFSKTCEDVIRDTIAWIHGRSKRASARPGGLGRRKAKR